MTFTYVELTIWDPESTPGCSPLRTGAVPSVPSDPGADISQLTTTIRMGKSGDSSATFVTSPSEPLSTTETPRRGPAITSQELRLQSDIKLVEMLSEDAANCGDMNCGDHDVPIDVAQRILYRLYKQNDGHDPLCRDHGHEGDC